MRIPPRGGRRHRVGALYLFILPVLAALGVFVGSCVAPLQFVADITSRLDPAVPPPVSQFAPF